MMLKFDVVSLSDIFVIQKLRCKLLWTIDEGYLDV